MTNLIPTIGFTWSEADVKASISLTDDLHTFLGGEGAEVHLAVVGRQLRVVAGKRPEGRSCTMSRQAASKDWPWRVQQKLVGQLAGYNQGITVLECELVENGTARWVQFDIPSNMVVSNDPQGLPSDPDLILKDLGERVANARQHGISARLSVVRTRNVVEEMEL